MCMHTRDTNSQQLQHQEKYKNYLDNKTRRRTNGITIFKIYTVLQFIAHKDREVYNKLVLPFNFFCGGIMAKKLEKLYV